MHFLLKVNLFHEGSRGALDIFSFSVSTLKKVGFAVFTIVRLNKKDCFVTSLTVWSVWKTKRKRFFRLRDKVHVLIPDIPKVVRYYDVRVLKLWKLKRPGRCRATTKDWLGKIKILCISFEFFAVLTNFWQILCCLQKLCYQA